jgi:hypothetical protein
MKKYSIILAFLMCFGILFAQEEEEKKEIKPVRSPFASGVLIGNQTGALSEARTLEMIIEHNFGTIQNGITDLYGLYAPSNIRLGLNYSISNNITVGFGAVKYKKLTDFRIKWSILTQAREGGSPIAITYYGNMAIDGRNKDVFTSAGQPSRGTDRFSYFNQIIFGRKFCDAFSMQFAPSISHINKVEATEEHDKIAISFSGRLKFSDQGAFIFTYDAPLHIEEIQEHTVLDLKSKPNLALGVEFATGTHVFQMFMGTATSLSPQYNMMTNLNDWQNGAFFIGFNITRFWNF